MTSSLVGSEMCIRDRPRGKTFHPDLRSCELSQYELEDSKAMVCQPYLENCLLYTSDAADDM
eukprot:11277835-Prorocentrum_lima.AAC.1